MEVSQAPAAPSSKPLISGIIAACLTPFDEAGKVDYGALEREIDFIVSHADAISIGAVEAAEYTMLTPEQRRDLLRVGTEIVDKRLQVILGASSPAPKAAIELAEYAARVGANLVQVLMPLRPWGPQPTPAELIGYFTEVSERSPLPLVAYHNPGPGSDPSIDTLVKLADLDNIHYFKESSRDVTKISRLIELIDRAGKARYFTTMQPLLATLVMGGSGGTMPPPGTWIGAQVVRAFREGDMDGAVRWARLFATFPSKWPAYGLPPVMKAAMQYLGMDIGEPVPPYAPVTDADREQIVSFLHQSGVTPEALRPAATART